MDELLKANNITDVALADWLGVTRMTIYNLRKGDWLKLNVEQVELVAIKLKVKQCDLQTIILRDAKNNI